MTHAVAILTAAAVAGATAARAGATMEQLCQSARVIAGKYAQCAGKAAAKYHALNDDVRAYSFAAGKCVRRYAATWPKLQAKTAGSGATCDNPRFSDNGDDTIVDRLTGLVWEKKVDDGTLRDKDNSYAWSAGGSSFTAADGTAFTTFLATLNGGACLAGQCDWRLPALDELLTVVTPFDDCRGSPCIDPLFGPTVASSYWSSTTDGTYPYVAWTVEFVPFINLNVQTFYKGNGNFVRAVRGGL